MGEGAERNGVMGGCILVGTGRSVVGEHTEQSFMGHLIDVDAYPQQFPVDVSPYGVAGLGGNLQTWCRNRWRASGPNLAQRDGQSRLIVDEMASGSRVSSSSFAVARGFSRSTSVGRRGGSSRRPHSGGVTSGSVWRVQRQLIDFEEGAYEEELISSRC
ncbi:MAG: hypothetical protein R3F65_09445 [bacterium]